jgi:hypothetical protein
MTAAEMVQVTSNSLMCTRKKEEKEEKEKKPEEMKKLMIAIGTRVLEQC